MGGDYKTTGSQVYTGSILLAPTITTTIASTNGPLTIGTAGGDHFLFRRNRIARPGERPWRSGRQQHNH
jgi:hypothetical protein